MSKKEIKKEETCLSAEHDIREDIKMNYIGEISVWQIWQCPECKEIKITNY